jgi:uncharacterized integral membrane protein (TIGR00698 family)
MSTIAVTSAPYVRWVSVAILGLGCVAVLHPAISGAEALLLGVAVGLLNLNPWTTFTRPAATILLQVSVIGLGAAMNLAVIWGVGIGSIGYTIAGIAFTFVLGFSLGRYAGLSRDLTVLLSSGTAICGGSAIAAVAGVLRPKQEETTIALATVFLLNAVALITFPLAGHALGLGQHAFGLWAALAIHDTSSVVAAGASFGEQALKVATTVKLTRALWIAPLALAIGWKLAPRGDASHPRTTRVTGMWFIVGFAAMAALVTWIPTLRETGAMLAAIARRLLVVTLFLIGSNLSRGALTIVGWRPLAVGTILWLGVSLATLGGILSGWIR